MTIHHTKNSNNFMRRIILVATSALFLACLGNAHAQVSDVNFVVSPSLGYTMWNSQLNLGNTATYGARVGFAFGPILELRGNYERSFDLKSTLDNAGWSAANKLAAHVDAAKVRYERWGGDVKVNLWSNAIFTPYVLGGMGMLKFNYDDAAGTGSRIREEKLYGNLGAGLKVNLARRVALSFEVRDMLFNVSPSSQYATLTERKTLSNWNAMASLDFYLGGTQYSKDEVTQAYRRTFNGGFRGLRFAIEPSAAYLNFRDHSLYRDTWMLGLSAGVDFTSLIGLRGFYYRSTKDPDKFSFNTNGDLSIYGANLITRLNTGNGVTPYLSLGAGYMRADKNYVDRAGKTGTTDNGWFALGGMGIDVPLHRYVSLFGAAEAMFVNKDNPQLSEIADPAKVNVNWMYRAGVRVNVFSRGRSGLDTYRRQEAARVAAERALGQEELRKQRGAYDARIDDLDAQLRDAALRLDTAQVRALEAERSRVEAEAATRSTVSKSVAPTENVAPAAASRIIYMTPSQLNELIRRVLSAADGSGAQSHVVPTSSGGAQLSDMDKILLISALRNGQLSPAAAQQVLPYLPLTQSGTSTASAASTVTPTVTQSADQVRIDALMKQIADLRRQLDKAQRSNTVVQPQVVPVRTRATQTAGTKPRAAVSSQKAESSHVEEKIDNHSAGEQSGSTPVTAVSDSTTTARQ